MKHTFAVVREVDGQRGGNEGVHGKLLPDNLTDKNHTHISVALGGRERGSEGGNEGGREIYTEGGRELYREGGKERERKGWIEIQTA